MKAAPPRDQPRLPGMDKPEPAPAARSSAIGDALSDEQEPAVARRSEPLLLSAAAGSGKTSVLVERFVRAVREDGVAPGRILAITFTDRAAGELRTRIRASLLALGERQQAQDAESAFLTTFHGFCARLLRAHPLACGLDPEFEILDEGLAARLRDRAFSLALRQQLGGASEPALDLAAAYGVDRLRRMVEQAFLELRSHGERRPRLPAVEPAAAGERDEQALAACEVLDELLGRFADAYEQLKRARGGLDFDDLELRAAELLHERDEIRRSYVERFQLLMVDEFQDTNARQLRILDALDGGNLFTVGDELQSIYGFRHADVRLFRARREALQQHGRSLALTRNYRSRPAVLEVVNAAFAARFEGFAPLRAGRVAAARPGPAVELLLSATAGWDRDEALARRIGAGLPDGQPWRQAEARLLAQRVAQLIREGEARAGEVVVLLRSTPDLEIYERALQLCGLRTLATVGTFWGQQQIGDLLSYLRALANPLDEQALFSALASPLGGCSRDGLAILAAMRRADGGGLWQTMLDLAGRDGPAPDPDPDLDLGADFDPDLDLDLGAEDRAALVRFRELLAGERAIAANHSIASLIERALLATGYEEHVTTLDWGERRLANLDKLLRQARRFEQREGRDLRAFLDHVRHLERMAALEPQAPLDGEHDAVRLMSVHAAKGLEFEVVCVADLGRRPRLTQPDLLVDGPRLGLRLVTLDGAEPRPALAYADLAAARAAREAAEEDRVLYVAMTRARERLLLSGAADFERWPSVSAASPPIAWLVPALAPELPERLAAGEEVESIALASVHVNSPETAGGRLRLPDGSEAQLSVPRPPAPDRARRPRPRPADGGADEVLPTLSYTALAELERCGYRFYLERVLGLPEDRAAARADGGLKARERGTLVHALMERLDLRRPRAPATSDTIALAAKLGISVSEPEAAEAGALVGATLATELMQRIVRLGDARREHPFAFALAPQDPLVVGFIDLLGEEGDESLLLVDYKTDRVAPEADLQEVTTREYAAQRLVYALAALRGGAARVEVAHWFLERPHEPVSATFQAARLPALEAELAALMRRPHTVSPRPHRGLCLTCPGRGELCSWGEEMTLRASPDAP